MDVIRVESHYDNGKRGVSAPVVIFHDHSEGGPTSGEWVSREFASEESSKSNRSYAQERNPFVERPTNPKSGLTTQEASDLISKSIFECMCDVIFWGADPIFHEERRDMNDIRVRVLATNVPPTKQVDDAREPIADIEEGLLVSHFVGIAPRNEVDPRDMRDPTRDRGTLVTSTRKCHVRAQHTTIPADELISVPETLDPGEAVSLVSTFLPAFAALHHGDRRARGTRYSSTCLKGRQVLITGGTRLDAQAAVKLAILAGASGIYVLNSGRNLSRRIHGGHVAVLKEDPEEWLPVVKGDMDVVIDFDYPRNHDSVLAAIAPKGRLVCVCEDRNQRDSLSFISKCQQLIGQSALCALAQASIFDYDEYLRYDIFEIKRDLGFLFRLLERRKIRPNIDKYVKIRDIPLAQEEMVGCAMVGSIVCEP